MRIAVFAKSTELNRQIFNVALLIDELLDEKKIETDLIDLDDYKIPVPGNYNNSIAETEIVSSILQKADAVVLVTSLHYGIFSCDFRNLLECYRKEIRKKPIGVVIASTEKTEGANAATQFWKIILALNAHPLPATLPAQEVQYGFDKNLDVISPSIASKSERFVNELIQLTNAIFQAKQQIIDKELKL